MFKYVNYDPFELSQQLTWVERDEYQCDSLSWPIDNLLEFAHRGLEPSYLWGKIFLSYAKEGALPEKRWDTNLSRSLDFLLVAKNDKDLDLQDNKKHQWLPFVLTICWINFAKPVDLNRGK